MSKNKGLTGDVFSDNWFRTTERWDIINDWWNEGILELLNNQIFSARLIPLNKVWPEIPHSD